MSTIDKKHVTALVKKVHYFHVPGTTVTVCAVILLNGFTVIGQSSCLDPVEFDEQVGMDTAYNNALSKVYEFEGYRMYQVRHDIPDPSPLGESK